MISVTDIEWIRVAAARNDDAAAESMGETESGDTADTIRRMRCRVLIVDDDALFRESLAARLRDAYLAEVYEAEDALMALRMLTEMSPLDLVLMDVEMPELDGLEASPRMREAGGFGHIVLMSGNARYREQVLASREELLDKSLDEDRFTAALEQILLRCRGGKA